MILTVTVCNRTISFALFENSGEAPHKVCHIAAAPARTADEYAALLCAMPHCKLINAPVNTVVVASVVPALTDVLCQTARMLYPDALCLTVGAGLRSGLAIRTDTPTELGADLVAVAVGAATLQHPPFLVLNCGDVTTLCAVDGGKEGPVFLGCAILPGATLGGSALRREAALLGDVALCRPQRAIGKNTTDSVRAGLLLGHAAAIEGLISSFETEMERGTLPVIVTGEESALLLPLLHRDTLYDEVLAHKGLCHIASLNARKSQNPHKRG